MELQGLHGQMWQTVPEEMICTVLYSNNNTILGVFITIYPYPSFVSFIMLKSVTLQENKTILEYTLDRPGPAAHVFLVVAFLCQNTVVIC